MKGKPKAILHIRNRILRHNLVWVRDEVQDVDLVWDHPYHLHLSFLHPLDLHHRLRLYLLWYSI